MLELIAIALLVFVGFYPIVTSAFWIAGGLLFRIFDEPTRMEPPPGGWPGVTILIPAYNEEQVIAGCVGALGPSTTRISRCSCSTTGRGTPRQMRRRRPQPATGASRSFATP